MLQSRAIRSDGSALACNVNLVSCKPLPHRLLPLLQLLHLHLLCIPDGLGYPVTAEKWSSIMRG